MFLIDSLPCDLVEKIARKVEEIRLRTYFTKHVLPLIPRKVKSINSKREFLQKLWCFGLQGSVLCDQMLEEWYKQHYSDYEIISPHQRIGEHLWLEQGVFLYWELDEDGDWIVGADKRGLPAHKRCW